MLLLSLKRINYSGDIELTLLQEVSRVASIVPKKVSHSFVHMIA